MFASLKHAWQLAYAGAIVYLHGLMLNGPVLLGPKAFGAKLIAAGLGAYAGTALAAGLLKASARKGSKREAIVASAMIAVFGLLAAATFVTHGAYFDGTQTEFSTGQIWAYRLSIVVLSFLMRAFLASVLAAREIDARKKG